MPSKVILLLNWGDREAPKEEDVRKNMVVGGGWNYIAIPAQKMTLKELVEMMNVNIVWQVVHYGQPRASFYEFLGGVRL